MRLSTSTNIFFNRPDGSKADLRESIALCAQAGYRVMDMNFYDCTTFRTPFVGNGWEDWLEGICKAAQEYQVEFSQAHSHFFQFFDQLADWDFHNRMVYRSVDCAARLGVKWLVIHAATDFDSVRLVEDSRRKNYEYLAPVAEYAQRRGVGLAIENLWDLNISPKRRYTVTAEELVELVDLFQSEQVGVCWDFEHADIMQQDQAQALTYIGKRLKATHVSEQASPKFDHLLPFTATADWKHIMPLLHRIGYEGDFTYEIHRYTSTMPRELVPAALRYSVEVGNYLLSLAKAGTIEGGTQNEP